MIKHASLFNGIGGFQLAAEWMGWQNTLSCEIDEFCNRITKYYWPNCIQHEDIKTTDFTIYRGTIDILTGGFPCQPYSTAGKRKGTEDARHLWPQMLRAITEIKPPWVVGENVGGLISWNGGMVFEQIHLDLEAAGYQVFAFILPACGKNAPHKRDRIWFIAHSTGANNSKHAPESIKRQTQELRKGIGRIDDERATTDTTGKRGLQGEQNLKSEFNNKTSENGFDANDHQKRFAELHNAGFASKQRFDSRHNIEDWSNWPTQSPICNGDDGLSSKLDGITFPKWRAETIKGGGNAIVPQVAYEIFKVIDYMIHNPL